MIGIDSERDSVVLIASWRFGQTLVLDWVDLGILRHL